MVINANQTAGIYQMRFAGLFDCKNLEAHGVAILNYNESSNNVDNFELTYTGQKKKVVHVCLSLLRKLQN